MLNRIYARLEILGYNRAISSIINRPGITAEHMKGLYQCREDAIQRLANLKVEAKLERFGKTLSNA